MHLGAGGALVTVKHRVVELVNKVKILSITKKKVGGGGTYMV
jgi:hypothetical protein